MRLIEETIIKKNRRINYIRFSDKTQMEASNIIINYKRAPYESRTSIRKRG
jgi:hypothetical protein